MSLSVWADITKYQTGWLINNTPQPPSNVFLHFRRLEVQDEDPTWWDPDESALLGCRLTSLSSQGGRTEGALWGLS